MPTNNNAENAGPATAAATNPTLNLTPAAGQGAPDLQVSLAGSTPAASPELGASPKLACELPLPRGGGSRRFRIFRCLLW